MSNPKLDNKGSLYKFTWEEEKIIIELSKFYEQRDNTLTCQLLATTTHPKYTPHLTQTRFNLSSSLARTKLKNQLEQLYPEKEANWAEMLETMCVQTLKLRDMGEPVHDLWTSDEDINPPEFVLSPLVLKQLPIVIYGEKGANKSTFTLVLAICLQLPWYDNPLGIETLKTPLRVLWLDWEQELSIVKWQLREIQRGMNLPDLFISYRRCYQPLIKDLEQIQRHIHELNADVTVIDSLGLACGGELKEAQTALSFYSAVRQLNQTTIIIGQTSKEDSRDKKLFGSTFFEYMARAVWEIKAQEIDENTSDIALFHRQGNYTKRFNPLGFRIHRNDTGIKIEQANVDLASFIERINKQQQAVEFLKINPMTTTELQAELKISRSYIDVITKKLRDKNLIAKRPDSKWVVLTNREEEHPEDSF